MASGIHGLIASTAVSSGGANTAFFHQGSLGRGVSPPSITTNQHHQNATGYPEDGAQYAIYQAQTDRTQHKNDTTNRAMPTTISTATNTVAKPAKYCMLLSLSRPA